MKFIQSTIIATLLAAISAHANAQPPRFEDYAVKVYMGRWSLPGGIVQISQNEWRDEFGKRITPPSVNFAGKYNISLHSCGSGCRYHRLTDLSTGKDFEKVLAPFASMEPPPKTKAGHRYVTDLISKADSAMLIAQYSIERPEGTECREKVFVLEPGKMRLRPITPTTACTAT